MYSNIYFFKSYFEFCSSERSCMANRDTTQQHIPKPPKWCTFSQSRFCRPISPLEDKASSQDSCCFGNVWRFCLASLLYFTNNKETHGVCCVKYSVISDVWLDMFTVSFLLFLENTGGSKSTTWRRSWASISESPLNSFAMLDHSVLRVLYSSSLSRR